MLRDGVWAEQDAVILVPGDIVSIKLGDIIPADARLLEGDPLKIDQVSDMDLIVSPSSHVSINVLHVVSGGLEVVGWLLLLLQSALTGESLPVTKHPGDGVYSGSTCKQGEVEAVVIATGVHSFFGKAAHLVDSTNQVGHFQKVSIVRVFQRLSFCLKQP